MAAQMPEKTIYVCPLDAVDEVMRAAGPSHLVTLINGDMLPETPKSIKPDNHLRLIMHDVSAPGQGLTPPDARHMSRLLAFGRAWQAGADHPDAPPLLIHCWAGISRSTAAAYILLCALNPGADEFALARLLRRASDTATPNPLMIRIADALLKRNGRMVRAIAGIGRGAFAAQGQVFSLPARLQAEGELS